MKLSEAMLKGLTMVDGQCQEAYLKVEMNEEGKEEKLVCGLGAAYVATFGLPIVDGSFSEDVESWVYRGRKLNETYPVLKSRGYDECPGEDCDVIEDWSARPLVTLVIHLNDNHDWSIRKIANWLDSLGF